MRAIVAATVMLGVAIGMPASAEVRGVVDRLGSYRETRILFHGEGMIWTPIGGYSPLAPPNPHVLNPAGDQIGDRWPILAESTVFPFLPWAVWSRNNDGEFDLVWSRWLNNSWQPVEWLAESDHMGDDLDAELGFDATGRPRLVWWRDESGVGRIYFSVFLETQWMQPLAVSLPGRDGRFPSIISIAGGETVIRYMTPEGPVQQSIVFAAGDGITDDIDPLDVVTVDVPLHIEEHF